MIPSREALALMALQERPMPPDTRVGDLWLCVDDKGRERPLEYVMLVLGHKKNGRRREGHTYVYMYHWAEPSLRAQPCDLRDNDGNARSAEHTLRWHVDRGNRVKYLGNLFALMPHAKITAVSES